MTGFISPSGLKLRPERKDTIIFLLSLILFRQECEDKKITGLSFLFPLFFETVFIPNHLSVCLSETAWGIFFLQLFLLVTKLNERLIVSNSITHCFTRQIWEGVGKTAADNEWNLSRGNAFLRVNCSSLCQHFLVLSLHLSLPLFRIIIHDKTYQMHAKSTDEGKLNEYSKECV